MSYNVKFLLVAEGQVVAGETEVTDEMLANLRDAGKDGLHQFPDAVLARFLATAEVLQRLSLPLDTVCFAQVSHVAEDWPSPAASLVWQELSAQRTLTTERLQAHSADDRLRAGYL